MEDSREDHCRGVSEYGVDKKNIHDLRWDLYTIEKE